MRYTLVINAGSSSLKFKLFNDKLAEVADGIIEKIGLKGSFINYNFFAQPSGRGQKKPTLKHESMVIKNHEQALEKVLTVLEEHQVDFQDIVKVGHRVVHGGEKFVKPALVNTKVVQELKKFNKLAPLHNPHNLSGILACLKALPKAKNYAIFDTAFHATISDYVYLYALPYSFYKKYAIRKYGFHGTSHHYVSLEAGKKLKKRKPNLITCHLGSGCSITAVKQGQSVDTSMGFTPLEGLMMGTRTGDIDPAVVFYLKREGFSVEQIDKLFNQESGLTGVSGLKDMRDILIANGYKIPGYKATEKITKEKKILAKLALKMFVYRIQKYIGAYSTVLGKVDALVFTAGIGERSKPVRDLILKGLSFKLRVLVIPTNEELMMAKLISK